MSDMGLFISKFHTNTNSLRQFNTALRYLKQSSINEKSQFSDQEMQKLLVILVPIKNQLSGRLSNSLNLNEQSLVDNLRQRHQTDWQRYRDTLLSIISKLESKDTSILPQELEALEDVADALDTECADLFRRINGRL